MSDLTASSAEAETVVADPPWWRAVVWTVVPLLGAAAGAGVVLASSWIAGLRWAPFHGLFKAIASFPRPQALIGGAVVGLILGLLLAALIHLDSLTIRVGRTRVVLKRGDKTQEYARSAVAAAYLDGKQLVLLDSATRELAREASDHDKARIAAAFSEQGYPWLDADPHGDAFRRWVDGDPDLPGAADALLRARAKAIERRQSADVAELRTELAKLGVVVRTEKTKQYWRLIKNG